MNKDDQLPTPIDFFDTLYQKEEDPYHFMSDPYERAKYQATIAALSTHQYTNAFEIGCSIGVLTAMLAPYCQHLLAVDCSLLALERAQARCMEQQNIVFQQMTVPLEFPDAQYDLVLLSEVGYYWSLEDLSLAQERIFHHLVPGGFILLVHWMGYREKTEHVHGSFMSMAGLQRLYHQYTTIYGKSYRLDLLQKDP